MDFATTYDFLKAQVDRYDRYYYLAAVKGSLLLTSNAILVAPMLSQPGSLVTADGGPKLVLLVTSVILSIISIAFAGLVIASFVARPKGGPGIRSFAFTESLAQMTIDEYRQGLAELHEASVIADLAGLAHMLGSTLVLKFRFVNISLAALVAAIMAALATSIAPS